MAKGSQPDDIFEFVVTRPAPSYVGKLSGSVLRTKGLKQLGQISDFTPLRIKCFQQHFMQ